MNKKSLFALWGGLFIVCAGLGFIRKESQPLLTLLSVAFFLPPAVLIYQAGKEGDGHTLKLIRNLAGLSLGLTLVLLVANVACALGSEGLGVFLHLLLTVVSAPMVCSGYWVLSLFLWACLLMASISALKGLTQKR